MRTVQEVESLLYEVRQEKNDLQYTTNFDSLKIAELVEALLKWVLEIKQ